MCVVRDSMFHRAVRRSNVGTYTEHRTSARLAVGLPTHPWKEEVLAYKASYHYTGTGLRDIPPSKRTNVLSLRQKYVSECNIARTGRECIPYMLALVAVNPGFS